MRVLHSFVVVAVFWSLAVPVSADSRGWEAGAGQAYDGRINPEAIPPDKAWLSFFAFVVAVTHSDDNGQRLLEPNPDMVAGLAQFGVGVSTADMWTLITIAKATLARKGEIERPLNEEHQGLRSLPWTPAQRQAQIQSGRRAVLEGMLDLKKRVPHDSFQVFERYVESKVKPGMKGFLHSPRDPPNRLQQGLRGSIGQLRAMA